MTTPHISYHPGEVHETAGVFKRRHVPVLAILVVGAILAFLAFTVMDRSVRDRAQFFFDQVAVDRLSAIEQSIELNMEMVRSVVGFFNGSSEVNRNEFGIFTSPILFRQLGFRSFSWVPRVQAADRAAVVQRAHEDGFPDFRIFERSENGETRQAAIRERSFPILFVEPILGNEDVLGLDLASEFHSLLDLQIAARSGEIWVAAASRLTGEDDNQFAADIIAPVYLRGKPLDGEDLRLEYLQGFVIGKMRISDTVEIAVQERVSVSAPIGAGIDYYVYDLSDDVDGVLLHVEESIQRPDAAPVLTLSEARQGMHLARNLFVGGRQWVAVARPVAPNFLPGVFWEPWAAVIAVLAVAALLARFINIALQRREFAESLVAERTGALHASEKRFQAIADDIPDGMITIDEYGLIESFNPAAERIFGYASEEVTGRNVKVLMPEEERRRHDSYLQNYKDTGKAGIIGKGREVIGQRKDGTTFPLDLTVSETDFGGHKIYTGIIRDITDRKTTEAALVQKTELLTLLHSIADTANQATKLDDVIQFAINSICAFTGWPIGHAYLRDPENPDILVSSGIWHISDTKRFDILKQITEDTVFLVGQGLPGTIVATGRPRWFTIEEADANFLRAELSNDLGLSAGFGLPIMVKDRAIGVLEFFNRTAEAPSNDLMQAWMQIGGQLGRVAERFMIDQIKNEFVSTVSHELRTPLTSIQGSLGLIRGGALGSDLPEDVSRMIEVAYNNSDRLVRLINDILDIEKIESGKMEFVFENQSVASIIREAVDLNASYADQYDVTIKIEGDLPNVVVNGDHDRLMQVLANLLSNAAKFSPEGGIVRIGASVNDGKVTVRVVDNGPGIGDEFKERIFGKFAQADASDSRQKGGTGLGLSITKAIVEHHGGGIGFESQTGRGTEFFFWLPVLDVSAEALEIAEDNAVGPATPRNGGRARRILICEDDADISMLLTMILKQGGYESDVAQSCAEARRLLASKDYAAMTLDLILPDEDGISLIHELRADMRTQDLPIVVVSAKAEQGRKKLNGDVIDVIDWLGKPIDSAQLKRALDKATQSGEGKPRVLHVEDDPSIRSIVGTLISKSAVVISAGTYAEAKKMLKEGGFDLVILDLILPDGSGEDLLPLLRDGENGHIPAIIFSAREMSRETAEKVSASLVKSRTSNDQLLSAIQAVIS